MGEGCAAEMADHRMDIIKITHQGGDRVAGQPEKQAFAPPGKKERLAGPLAHPPEQGLKAAFPRRCLDQVVRPHRHPSGEDDDLRIGQRLPHCGDGTLVIVPHLSGTAYHSTGTFHCAAQHDAVGIADLPGLRCGVIRHQFTARDHDRHRRRAVDRHLSDSLGCQQRYLGGTQQGAGFQQRRSGGKFFPGEADVLMLFLGFQHPQHRAIYLGLFHRHHRIGPGAEHCAGTDPRRLPGLQGFPERDAGLALSDDG